MRLSGNIRQITSTRNNSNKDVTLHINTIEYTTHKKDGRFYQPFSFEYELETPLVLTGDCLALVHTKHLDEGEYEFFVYDKEGEDYVLNENKLLSLSIAYDYEANVTILNALTYAVTVSNEEYNQLKSESAKRRRKKGKGSKNSRS